MNDDDQNASLGGKRRRPAMAGRLDGEPYRVGKGKPPREHQWTKGCPSPNRRGRPKGSTKANTLEKFLNQPVPVGSKNGKQLKKPLREVVDHRLVEQAAQGDLKAIKLIYDILHMQRRLGLVDQPSPAELARQREEEEEKQEHAKRISAFISDVYSLVGHMKKLGIVEFVDDRPVIQQWAHDEAQARGFGRKRPPAGSPSGESTPA
jgi:hypothetical protein